MVLSMLNIIHLHFAVAAAKRRFDLIQKKFPDLKASLVLALAGGQTGIDSSPAQILGDLPAMIVDGKIKTALLSLLSRLKKLESESAPPDKTARGRKLLDTFASLSNYDEKCLVEIRFNEINADLLRKLQADDLVDRKLTPQTKDSRQIVLGTIAHFARSESGFLTTHVIVDIGSGGCGIAINSPEGIVFSRSLRVGGEDFDTAIIVHLKRTHNLLIEKQAAELIKLKIGSAFPLTPELAMEISGRDLTTGRPKTLTIGSEEIRGAFQENLSHILLSLHVALEHCPPELAADLAIGGILLTGGGSLLRGMDRLVAEATHLPVHIVADPKTFKLPPGGVTDQDLHQLAA